jgi:hypothetical protein
MKLKQVVISEQKKRSGYSRQEQTTYHPSQHECIWSIDTKCTHVGWKDRPPLLFADSLIVGRGDGHPCSDPSSISVVKLSVEANVMVFIICPAERVAEEGSL